MGKIVVVAEKPSVGRDIARVLGCRTGGDGCLIGDRYIVTWAVGHLVTLMEPNELDPKYEKWSFATLPILPETIPLKVISQTKDQFSKVKKLINSQETDSLICATDAGREGELIFRYIYEKAQCQKPFQRLWISSMTDEAITEGFRDIRPGADYDGLYESARCRSKADWLVGMNASRAFTLKYNTLLSIGRVQTPTLAILVKRRKEIEDFKPEGFCTLTADFGDYSGVYFSEKLDPDTHLKEKEDAEKIAAEVKGKTGTVIQAETTRKKELPPQLYDLTSLQRDANRMLGFTADKTLKTAQSLYEKHKALTYPRTDSRFLPPDMIPRVVQTMKLLPEAYQKFVPGALPGGKLPVSKRTIDQTKVTDHHAIIPTAKRADPSKFTEDERKLYDMVARRMLAAFYPACDYDATKIVTKVDRIAFEEVFDRLNLDTMVSPKHITAEHILQYVRAMKNSYGSNVETLHRMLDDQAEALEFLIRDNFAHAEIPLKDLALKQGVLVACINRKGKIILPRGNDVIRPGDTVVIITSLKGLNDISDIFQK